MLVANEVLATDEVSSIEGSNKLIKKCGKLSKTRKSSKSQKLSKFQKLSKSQKLAKLKKELSKSGNLPNFDAKENEPSFLTPDTRTAFNYLWLAFTRAPILQHFALKYYIWIETDASSYKIGGVLSQFVFETKPDKVVTKTDLGQCVW